MTRDLDRSSPIPLYHQLKLAIVADIGARALGPGDRLPGDFELCSLYDVSRTVARQALNELEVEGVIERAKGRGTFVAQKKANEGLAQSLTGLFEDVAARGGHLRSEIRRLEVIPADEAIAADLEIAAGTPVIALERLRFVDDVPWVLTTTFLPESLAPGVVHEDLRDRSLYAVLEDSYGVRLVRGTRTIEATTANEEQARLLRIRKGAALLVLRSVSVGEAGRPVEAFVAYHRGDRSRFQVHLARTARGGSTPLVLVTG